MKRIYRLNSSSISPLQKIISAIFMVFFVIGFFWFGIFILGFLLVAALIFGIFTWWKVHQLKKNPQFKAFMDQMQNMSQAQSNMKNTDNIFQKGSQSAAHADENMSSPSKDSIIIEGESREIK